MKKPMLLLSLFALCCAGAAHADDWTQFRHDASRSGVSKDKLKFPLRESWTWKTKSRNGHTPLFHAVVKAGKIYFTASENEKRWLICADSKTGKVIWRKPLQTEKLDFALSDAVGPAISSSGRVFVYDWLESGKNEDLAQALMKQYPGMLHCDAVMKASGFVVNIFDAEQGKVQTNLMMSMMGANGVLPRLSLLEGDTEVVSKVPSTFAGAPP